MNSWKFIYIFFLFYQTFWINDTFFFSHFSESWLEHVTKTFFYFFYFFTKERKTKSVSMLHNEVNTFASYVIMNAKLGNRDKYTTKDFDMNDTT